MAIKRNQRALLQQESLIQNWHNRGEHAQYENNAIKTKRYGLIVPFSPPALCSRTAPYIPSIYSHTNLLAAIVTPELSREQRATVFLTETSRSDVFTTLSDRPTLVKVFRQAFSDTSSIRKRTACDYLFRVLHFTIFCPGVAPSHPRSLTGSVKRFSWSETDLYKKL